MRRIGIVAAALLLVAAACGGDSEPSEEAATTATTVPPTTTAAPTTTSTTVTTTTASTTEAPQGTTFTGADGVETFITDTSRIVSLNGDLTEIIFELGLGSQVVAIDVTTTYPESASELPQVGFGQSLVAEPVLAFEPTLVIGDTQVNPPEAIQQLRDAGVPVVILETQTTLEGVETKISQVAEILGVPEEGAELANRVNSEIDEAIQLAAGAESSPNVAYVYTRGPQLLLIFGAGMPTQAMIENAGAIDVGASVGIRGALPLSAEGLVAAAPEVIVLPSDGLQALGGIEAFAQVPGVASTPAGESEAFLDYDEAYFFNLGPRVGQALLEFVQDLHPELAAS